MFAHKSTTQSRRNTEIGRKVVCATGDSAHQFQGQKVKGQHHQTDKCRDRKSAISSEREGLQTSNFVRGWSTETRIDLRHDLQAESSAWLFKSPLAGGGGTVAAALQAAQLVMRQFHQKATIVCPIVRLFVYFTPASMNFKTGSCKYEVRVSISRQP